MKMTLNLDDALLRRARKSAIERGISLTRVFEEALTEYLAPKRVKHAAAFKWIVVKDDSLPKIDLANRHALFEAFDRHR